MEAIDEPGLRQDILERIRNDFAEKPLQRVKCGHEHIDDYMNSIIRRMQADGIASAPYPRHFCLYKFQVGLANLRQAILDADPRAERDFDEVTRYFKQQKERFGG